MYSERPGPQTLPLPRVTGTRTIDLTQLDRHRLAQVVMQLHQRPIGSRIQVFVDGRTREDTTVAHLLAEVAIARGLHLHFTGDPDLIDDWLEHMRDLVARLLLAEGAS